LKKPLQVRWCIAALLATATALNYFDRQSLPVLVGELQKSIPITDLQYSHLQILFLFAYASMYAGGGRLIDMLGTRRGYCLMIAWWSTASFAHGLVSSVNALGAARFMLGLGEGGSFPGCAKAVSEWFAAEERSVAFGIFNSGSALGAIVAPPIIAGVTTLLGWRWVFYLSGLGGLAWAVAWLTFYRQPEQHGLISPEELVCGLLGARFLSDSAGYFLILWIPKYLGEVRHLSILQIGYYAWIPYLFAGVGSLGGGSLSSWLLRKHFTVDGSRKLVLGASAFLMPMSLFVVTSPLAWTILFFGLTLLGHQSWSTLMQTVIADIFPSNIVGTIAGLSGAAGAFGGMLFNVVAGLLLTGHSQYSYLFFIAGVLHPLAFGVILLSVGRIDSIAHRLPPQSA
jgi:ACS family hexuronate transporter-like MFS transporter